MPRLPPWFIAGLLPLISLSVCAARPAAPAAALLVESENFQFRGGWSAIKLWGQTFLAAGGDRGEPMGDAVTVITVPVEGDYTIWSSSRDFAHEQPGTRLYRVLVNGKPMPVESGKHGRDGFAWERLGRIHLSAGQAVLSIHDSTRHFARSDAVFLTLDDTLDPGEVTDLRAKYEIRPERIASTAVNPRSPVRPAPGTQWSEAAVLNNGSGKIDFLVGSDTDGNPLIVRRVAGAASEGSAVGETLWLIKSAADPRLSFTKIIPYWGNVSRMIEVRGRNYPVIDEDAAADPWRAGRVVPLTARKVLGASADSVELLYTGPDGETVIGRWALGAMPGDASLRLTWTPGESGYYSFAFSALAPVEDQAVTNVQLAPINQYQRLPETARLVPDTLTPMPAVIVETSQNASTAPDARRFVSYYASADPGALPLTWGRGMTASYGFSLRNAAGQIQPSVFAPLLGTPSSRIAAGQTFSVSFRSGVIQGDWKEAYAHIATRLYQVEDYRKQNTGTLTDAVFNMIDLIRHDAHSGWDAVMKGFYDIEADPHISPTVAQASPLALVSAAVLFRDEDFYVTRALPTIEYMLSRPGFRFSDRPNTPFFKDGNRPNLEVFADPFNTAMYQGLDALLEGKNPWISDLALPGGRLRPLSGYAVSLPAWTQLLAAHRLAPDKGFLQQAVAEADKFIRKSVYGPKTKPVDLTGNPFFNTSFYPYWWDLPDLFEATGDTRYLRAAEDAAWQTLTGIRVAPVVRDEPMTVHPGGKFTGDTSVFWKGRERFRLGFPVRPGDFTEHSVPQAAVSPVGLGFEQLHTLFSGEKDNRYILMSSWSPNLLRLHQHSGNPLFLTWARNGIIGRFANYPGYYLTGFTDLPERPDYPLRGPDVTSIYYHHIPPHLAFTLDYLVTEAIQRAEGQITFPWVRQEGFVWFSNRIYGTSPGKVFGDESARLVFDRNLISVDVPGAKTKPINHLMARSTDKTWIILMNEEDTARDCRVALLPGSGIVSASAARVHRPTSIKGVEIVIEDSALTVNVPAMGLVAVELAVSAAAPADRVLDRAAALTPVNRGYRTGDLGAPWGRWHAFRIRSPFGKDSLYVYTTDHVADGAKVGLELIQPDESRRERTRFPFEFSVYPVDHDATLRFRLILTDPRGNVTTAGPFELQGARP